ncbi:MAG TPA: bifunctional lysine ketoglutarate reductase /saccharopine dehydrogenase family protein [Melioribacteraceae bacterium]|nr:bifunctional lysine ketoglutarate reductase /saccharopine dehydrogenase family protein [Melioribacteraceae bacterium]
MNKTIGIRREDKNKWEVRVPIIPDTIRTIKDKWGINSIVQPFLTRAFKDDEYLINNAEINDDLSKADIIFAVKEIPIQLLFEKKTYLFFSHTIKGQSYNMPLLKALLEKRCTLIDYECIKDEKGRRLVFFGKYAGLAGMIDALHGLGKRLDYLGQKSPFLHVKPAYEYKDLADAEQQIKSLSLELVENGLLAPLVIGFAGYGNVSKGAQEILDFLPHITITPEELLKNSNKLENKIYKVVFEEKHLVKPKDSNYMFDLSDYYKNPNNYETRFNGFLPLINVLINAIYWDSRYPRLVTKEYLKNTKLSNLFLISDISCDIEGAIEITYKATKPDEPAYVYNPVDLSYISGYKGEGIVNMAVDNLPCELPRDSSVAFSNSLLPFIKEICSADYNYEFENLELSNTIKNAIITHNGKLTQQYKYLEKYL